MIGIINRSSEAVCADSPPHPPTILQGVMRRMILGLQVALIATAIPSAAIAADKKLNVGILTNKEHASDFDEAITSLKWSAAKYVEQDTKWEKLAEGLKKHDLLIGTLGSSSILPAKDAPDAAEKVAVLRKFIEDGGGIILTNVKDPAMVSWVPLLGENLNFTIAKPNPPPKENYKGEDFTQRKLAVERSPKILWPQEPLSVGFKPTNIKEWEAGGTWAGLQTILLKRIGRGFIAISTTRYPNDDLLKNVAKMRRLQELGLSMREIEFSFEDPVKRTKTKEIIQGIGEAQVGFRNISGAPLDVSAVIRVNNGKERRESRRSMKNIEAGKEVKLPVEILLDLRGETKLQVALVDPKDGSEVTLFEKSIDLPQYLTVVPPAYRGMISTARRDKNVHFKLRFAPIFDRHDEVKVALTVTNANGEMISQKEMVANGHDVAAVMDLPADAPEGVYKISAVATLSSGKKETAEGSFKIVPVRPGQVFVDQDTVLLKDGKPFFPIGIYHVTDEQVNEVADGGFNLIQCWMRYADPDKMDILQEKGIQALWEGYAWGALVRMRREFAIDPERMKTNSMLQERLQIQRDAVKLHKKHPALAMWYVADEPSPNALPGLKLVNQVWHEEDEDHPTYLVATGHYNLLHEACDVLGIDIYPVYRGARRPLSVIANGTDDALQGVDFRKPIIAIPQAFGYNDRHFEKPEDVRAMSYLFLTHGVRGIIWYCWKETGDITGNEGAGFNADTTKVLKELVAETKEIAPALMEPNAQMLKSDEGHVHAILCGSKDTGRYLVYVNSIEDPVKTKLEIEELSGKKLNGLFGTPKASLKKGVLSLDLPALATGIYKIE